MTRPEQPSVESSTSDALAADSRERAVRALLRYPPVRRLWSAQFLGGIGDALALLVLVLLAMRAAVVVPQGGGEPVLGGGYRGVALAVCAVFATRLLATFLFGVLLLGPLGTLTAPGGPLDRRWTMISTDGLRLALLIVAPLWIDWSPANALAFLLITVFLAGVAERFWTVARDSAAPGLLPAPPAEGASVRPLPDHLDALRRLWLRSGFTAWPVAAAGLVATALVSKLLGTFGVGWFDQHQVALASHVAAGLFAASITVLYFLPLPGTEGRRSRSPLEGLRRPKTAKGVEKGRTGAVPLLVTACAAVAGAIATAVALAPLHAADLGGGPVVFGLLVLGLTGGTAVGIRAARHVLPSLTRRRLLALTIALSGAALLAAGLTTDTTAGWVLLLAAGCCAGVAANCGHTLLDQETEEFRRPRTTQHLHAVVRVTIALGALVGPVLAALIGPHRVEPAGVVLAYGGAAFTLVLVGALLLPVAALVLVRTDDRHGVPLRHDLRDALRGGGPADVSHAPATDGFFIAVEGGDGAGKSTQVEALAEWIRGKGHEVVVTREPGATPLGKRLRAILLDVSSAGLSDRAEALLYAADRAEHVDSVIRPALERGAVVISDRYLDSSVAYQGAGRDLSPTEVARISRWATEGLLPHLTVLLDISPETARERFTEAPDRLESETAEFHQRVRSGFLALAAADPARYLVVDAGQEPEAVTTVIRHRLDQMLPLSAAELKAQEEARKAAEEERKRREAEEAARKAEEERQAKERAEQLARLRAEEEERKRREAEEARQREAERRAEEARRRAEEARRLAEEERQRRLAEEQTRREEEERRRRQAEEAARLRAEAEERRLEKQRRAEEALLRAERDRRAAESAAAVPDDAPTVPTPTVDFPKAAAEGTGGHRPGQGPSDADDTPTETVEIPRDDLRRVAGDPDEEETRVLPTVQPPAERRDDGPADAEETAVLPQQHGDPAAGPGGADATTWSAPPAEPPSGQAPPAQPDTERTWEMPRVDPAGAGRARPEWAEETPLDDLPSLADELLGPPDDEGDDGQRGRH